MAVFHVFSLQSRNVCFSISFNGYPDFSEGIGTLRHIESKDILFSTIRHFSCLWPFDEFHSSHQRC